MFRRTPVKSVIRYPGNKETLLRFYDKLIPEGFTSIVDAFGGSGVVSANATVDHVVYNELSTPLHDFIGYLASTSSARFIDEIQQMDARFGLAASTGDLEDRRRAFFSLRDAYNEHPTAAGYYLIIAYSFLSHISFNKDGKCNIACGEHGRALANDYEERIEKFCQSVQRPGTRFETVNGSYEDVDIPDGALVFLDPPYYGSAVLYGGWDFEAECRFLSWMEYLDRNGVKFMMTNNLFYGNYALETQILRAGFNRVRVPISVSRKSPYMRGEKNYGKAKKEVVITNFDVRSSARKAA